MCLRDSLLSKDKKTIWGLTTMTVEAVGTTDVCQFIWVHGYFNVAATTSQALAKRQALGCFHASLPATLIDRYCYSPSTDEETVAQRGNSLSTIIEYLLASVTTHDA